MESKDPCPRRSAEPPSPALIDMRLPFLIPALASRALLKGRSSAPEENIAPIPNTRGFRWPGRSDRPHIIVWVAVPAAILSQVYLLPKVLDTTDG